MTDVLVGRVRLRGDVRRFAAVAARTLPDALDDALADLDDVELGTLTVRLELDPAGLDDATLARLWAEEIRRAALAAGARPAVRPASRTAQTPAPPERDAARGEGAQVAPRACVDAAARAALAWLADGADRRRVPAELVALAEPGAGQALLDRLPAGSARRLVLALAPAAGPGVGADEPPPGHAPPPQRPRPVPEHDTDVGGVDDERHGRTVRDALGRAFSAGDGPGSLVEALALVAGTGDARERAGRQLDLTLVTRVGGLVLLYPWLAMLARLAMDEHPGDDPVTVRRLALARLADPDEAELADDPLVAWLAGADPERPGTPAARLRLAHPQAVDAEADRVLTAFAGLLTGFAGSSPGFVRRGWIRRTGVLAVEPHAVLTAATAPLDVALQSLPYPVALFRLPWTGALQVRLR